MKNRFVAVYNPYVNQDKKNEQLALLKGACDALRLELRLVPSNAVAATIGAKPPELGARKILFLEKNAALGLYLRNAGYWLYNSPESIQTCDSKALTHVSLMETKIRQPKTLIGPMTFGLKCDPAEKANFAETIRRQFDFPLIVKETHGSFGKQVYLVKDLAQLNEKLRQLNHAQLVVQEFFGTYRGQSLRALVVGQRIVACLKQINLYDFRSNLSQNAHAVPAEPDARLQREVGAIVKRLGLFYGGLDFVYDERKQPVFCEANSNAQLANISKIFERNLAIDLVKAVMRDKTYHAQK